MIFAQVVYASATLEVCSRKVRYYSAISTFLDKHMKDHPKLTMKHRSGSVPKLVMKDKDGQVQETIRSVPLPCTRIAGLEYDHGPWKTILLLFFGCPYHSFVHSCHAFTLDLVLLIVSGKLTVLLSAFHVIFLRICAAVLQD